MPSDLKSRLQALKSGAAQKKPAPSAGGLLFYTDTRPVSPALYSLPSEGLRRIGWSGRRFDIESCLFLDTETTGLSGGAGTVAFLVGVGFIRDGRLTVEQYLMKDYASEALLIDRLAQRMDAFDCVCTFNGRTFDMPLLESRFTMCRRRDRWREMENLDLLSPARRAWKLRIGSCRLSCIETEILGMAREGDLPGKEVPQRYFDYLKTGDFSLLEDIVLHNRQDIATLALLLEKLCALYAAPKEAQDKRDLFSLGKALERQGELRPARELYRASAIPAPAGTLQALQGSRISGMASWRGYLLARKAGDVEDMRRILEQMLLRRQMIPQVCIELSKLHEHKLKDPKRALEYALQARKHMPEDASLQKRIRRLTELQEEHT